jgi:hypothetical protein
LDNLANLFVQFLQQSLRRFARPLRRTHCDPESSSVLVCLESRDVVAQQPEQPHRQLQPFLRPDGVEGENLGEKKPEVDRLDAISYFFSASPSVAD